MREPIEADICVIGGGSGGLSVAAGAVQLGARTVLIERGRMGGDCLNYGCVPSKSLIAASRAAAAGREAARFGVQFAAPAIDFAAVHDHVHKAIATIAPNDSVERFERLGVTVIQASARFTGPDRVEAGGREVRARRFVIATGSVPAVPPIPGLADSGYLTNESVFELTAAPEHLIVIGGGPIGIELAQAHRRLGCPVTVLEAATIMPREDPELVAVVRHQLDEDGLAIAEGARVARVERRGAGVAVAIGADGGERWIEGSHLLVATGRKVQLDGLDLDQAGVAFTPKGVTVDRRLRTTNKRIYAIGDAAGGPQFTHLAGYHAGIVVRNALFRFPAKAQLEALPRVTFTSPELAQVGLTEAEAQAAHRDVRTLRWGLHDNDRAVTEADTAGMVKAVVTARGRILGAGIVGPGAGELIQVWGLAIGQKLGIGALATMIAPYPTLGEASKRAAGSFYTERLFGPRTQRLVRLLARFG